MEQLRTKRKSIKRSLTNFKTFINNFDAENDSITNLKLRLEKTEELWDKFEEAQSQIEEDGTEQASEQHRLEFEDKYFEVVTRAREILEQRTVSPRTSMSTETSVTNNTRMQLPLLTLPKFNGDFSKWLLFKDSFVATIHDNNSLSGVDKFRHLRSLLQGDALYLISSLGTTNENYVIAWNSLCDRYENERIIIHTHIKSLFEMTAISKEIFLRQTIDSFQIHLSALQALDEPIQHWDTMLIHLLSSKIDSKSRQEWEIKIADNKKKPNFKEFTQFLSSRCQVIEISDKMNKTDLNKTFNSKRNVSLATTTTSKNCNFCNKAKHSMFNCFKFLKLSVAARYDEVKRLKLCSNCFRSGHQSTECRAKGCPICGNNHNSLLHAVENSNEPTTTQSTTVTEAPDAGQEDVITCKMSVKRDHVLLPTALVKIYNSNDNTSYIVRALLDTGSQSNFITLNLVNKLKLKSTNINIKISGLNHTLSKTTNKCNLTINSLNNNYSKNISCLIIENITDDIPTQSVNINELKIPDNLELADNSFYECKSIDLLLGATLFFDIIQQGKITLGKNKPILQQTMLGWIVAGTTKNTMNNEVKSYLCTDTKELQNQLERFWQIEEPATESRKFSNEEEECLTFFEETTKRDKNGKFIVKMPLKNINILGDTLNIAISRLKAMERKFNSNHELKNYYINFMKEYEQAGHMTKINESDVQSPYYLPHHPVVRADSVTTKLRVVFDGSAMPSRGLSLNQVQKVGPTIQRDLFSIILNFRKHAIALTADVEKMYRQVWIDESDRHLQQIVWRDDQNEPISHYQLNTVTYGQAAAPFLAIRCLMQLAIEHKDQFPETCDIIQDDFYVDDLISGASTENEAFQSYQELTEILAKANMPLRKWNSNSDKLLKQISKTNIAQDSTVYVCEDTHMKTLGIHWNPKEDIFKYTVNLSNDVKPVTKRIVISNVSRIYDPLGLISPIIIIAKTFIQKLWQEKIDWDEPLNQELCAEWQNFIFSTKQIHDLKIPRFVLCEQTKLIDLHCFSDASERAYAACIYIKAVDEEGKSIAHLLCSKTKVAPLKTLSIPRLELCGAMLLSRLTKRVKQSLKANISKTFYWTDSTVVLSWLKTSPHLLKSFAANRVSEIQKITNEDTWQHVPTKQNPADIASRET